MCRHHNINSLSLFLLVAPPTPPQTPRCLFIQPSGSRGFLSFNPYLLARCRFCTNRPTPLIENSRRRLIFPPAEVLRRNPARRPSARPRLQPGSDACGKISCRCRDFDSRPTYRWTLRASADCRACRAGFTVGISTRDGSLLLSESQRMRHLMPTPV